MGKVRIKQVSTGLEELAKDKQAPTAQEKKKTKKRREKKKGLRAPGLKAGERAVVVGPSEKELAAAEARESPSRPSPPSDPSVPSGPSPSRRLHPRQQHGRSARYNKALKRAKLSDKVKSLALKEAVKLTKKTATAKFSEKVEAHINVSKAGLRTTVSLPYSTGKQRSILILTADPKSVKTPGVLQKTSGVSRSGSPDVKSRSPSVEIKIAGPEEIEAIKNSGSAPEVDEIWATPDIMKEIATIARILGPAGLMPNPKKDTIVKDAAAIKTKLAALGKGTVTLETERKTPIIHTILGKASMKEAQLTANLETILAALPPKQIKKVTLASTMGPGIKLSLDSKS